MFPPCRCSAWKLRSGSYRGPSCSIAGRCLRPGDSPEFYRQRVQTSANAVRSRSRGRSSSLRLYACMRSGSCLPDETLQLRSPCRIEGCERAQRSECFRFPSRLEPRRQARGHRTFRTSAAAAESARESLAYLSNGQSFRQASDERLEQPSGPAIQISTKPLLPRSGVARGVHGVPRCKGECGHRSLKLSCQCVLLVVVLWRDQLRRSLGQNGPQVLVLRKMDIDVLNPLCIVPSGLRRPMPKKTSSQCCFARECARLPAPLALDVMQKHGLLRQMVVGQAHNLATTKVRETLSAPSTCFGSPAVNDPPDLLEGQVNVLCRLRPHPQTSRRARPGAPASKESGLWTCNKVGAALLNRSAGVFLAQQVPDENDLRRDALGLERKARRTPAIPSFHTCIHRA
eukprot:scaffold1313_cov250-Pinguiococcus_pyrenoidosus.AAC.6